ncbi:MAG: ABC transporter ATP-binding protein [Phycisphaerales bacterium]|nr:ABC transporter ATP-binding protein [Phycisphaerales bacterium]
MTDTLKLREESGAKPPALSVRGLRFRYVGAVDTPPDAWTIDLPTLDVAQREQVLLTGGSGIGKSTLLHLIAGLVDPAEGTVLVDGTNIHALSGAPRDRFRGSAIGMIFQTFNLLSGFSALENVLAALMFSSVPRGKHHELAEATLSRLGITRLHAAPEELSVGQQQRVAVARAVVCRPALVLADEPTASLDPENAEHAMDLIQSVCRELGAALVCVSHDPAMSARFERREKLGSLVSTAATSATSAATVAGGSR